MRLDVTSTAFGGNLDITSDGALSLDSTNYLSSQGWANNSKNSIFLRGASITLNTDLIARGDSTLGSAGGRVRLTATTGDINLNNSIYTTGYVRSTARAGYGGWVAINASNGSITQAGNSTIDTQSVRMANVQALNGANWGGNVTLTARNNITINHTGTTKINTGGVTYSGASNVSGGSGGNISLTASNISLTRTGSGTPVYFITRGGFGYGSGYSGGNGGNVSFSLTNPANLSIAGYNKTTNFNVAAGGASAGGSAGTVGSVLLNGGAMP
jgi:hypothetical protein